MLLSTILLLAISFTACKKDEGESRPLRTKVLGKWQVNKIDVTTYSAAGVPTTVTTTYAASDYMEFRDNESDDVELGLGTTRQVGSFGIYANDDFFLDFSSKDLACVTNTITDNQFRFTGTVVGANPKVTETYYLSR